MQTKLNTTVNTLRSPKVCKVFYITESENVTQILFLFYKKD